MGSEMCIRDRSCIVESELDRRLSPIRYVRPHKIYINIYKNKKKLAERLRLAEIEKAYREGKKEKSTKSRKKRTKTLHIIIGTEIFQQPAILKSECRPATTGVSQATCVQHAERTEWTRESQQTNRH